MVLDDKIPWDSILASTMFALRATVYTTTQYTPAQLIFGRGSIINPYLSSYLKRFREDLSS